MKYHCLFLIVRSTNIPSTSPFLPVIKGVQNNIACTLAARFGELDEKIHMQWLKLIVLKKGEK